jgi:methionyl-tRNA formyltransferase
LRVVFMGTPDFAVPSLRALALEHDVVAVYTQPDRPAGRGREARPSAVKVAAQGLGLFVEQPATLRDAAVVDRLRACSPDVVCVVAYGAILPRAVLEVPRLGCVNVHASLLPRHRGAAPIERALLAGDVETGVAVMLMEEGLDTGPVALQTRIAVGEATAADLREHLGLLGAEALIAVLAAMEAGVAQWVPQDEAGATYAGKITAADLALYPELTAQDLVRRVRASGESAVSRAMVDGRLVTVEKASLHHAAEPPGPGLVCVSPSGLVLGTAGGAILVERLTPAGKRSMTALEFARGARLADGAIWDGPS